MNLAVLNEVRRDETAGLSRQPGVDECQTGHMHVQVLGPVIVDGEPLTPAHERIILATLVAFHGDVVTRDRLMDALWGDLLPKSATVTGLRSCFDMVPGSIWVWTNLHSVAASRTAVMAVSNSAAKG